ncbi:MAG: type VI secretion system tip protein VgrG [Candidatus Marinimicrobia bacterium]|nr:type VI secretion system tip protein VgrG [Candidatus Neomarinimicrobiota bacterium]MCF7880865.1 type VI secretion system tip protein VgrG [Candidatus Neomarinimicrobiota bacterium]
MPEERVIPTSASTDLPTHRVLIDGEEVSNEYHLTAVTVDKTVNRIPKARLVYLDGDAAEEDFPLSNSEVFIPGNEVEILTGYHSDESTIFKGLIISHGIKTKENKPAQLIVECRDTAVKMTVGRKNRYFEEMTDSDIMEEILGDYDVKSEVESTDATHQEMVQYYTTDWDFLVERAEANGKLVITDDGKISVISPDTGQEPALSVVYGSTIMEFEADMDARHQYSAISGNTWDYSSQDLLQEEGSDPSVPGNGNIDPASLAEVIGLDQLPYQHSGYVKDQELKTWASAGLLKSRLAKIIGRMKIQGYGEIKPGQMLEIDGVGDRFNGNAYVTAVRHEFTTRNWETHVQIGLNPRWFSRTPDIIDTQAAGLVPAVQGLHIGVVTQLEDDPNGEDRVRVKMPLVDTAADGIWARVASLDAGEERGAFFRPEIGDEVVLGFLNDDPRDAVILGMLNSSAKPAPLTASDDNPEKGFVTREELKLIFNDDKKSVTIETPNGNTIALSDDSGGITLEDENGNKIEMSGDGITIESAKDITIKASQNVSVEGGTNTEIKAGAQLTAEGSAGAELSSSATAKVQGALVQIN